MLKDITAVKPLDNYCLHIVFEDDIEGTVNIREIVEFTGIFSPLENLDYFSRVSVNPELGTICWPNDADLDPDVLYAIVTDSLIPTYADKMTVDADC